MQRCYTCIALQSNGQKLTKLPGSHTGLVYWYVTYYLKIHFIHLALYCGTLYLSTILQCQCHLLKKKMLLQKTTKIGSLYTIKRNHRTRIVCNVRPVIVSQKAFVCTVFTDSVIEIMNFNILYAKHVQINPKNCKECIVQTGMATTLNFTCNLPERVAMLIELNMYTCFFVCQCVCVDVVHL